MRDTAKMFRRCLLDGTLWDALAVVGLVVLLAGVAWMHVPTALGLFGFVLLGLGVWGASQHEEARPAKRRRRLPRVEYVGMTHDEDGTDRPLFGPAENKGHLVSEEEDEDE